MLFIKLTLHHAEVFHSVGTITFTVRICGVALVFTSLLATEQFSEVTQTEVMTPPSSPDRQQFQSSKSGESRSYLNCHHEHPFDAFYLLFI